MTQKTTKNKDFTGPYNVRYPGVQKNHHYIDEESLACVCAFLPPESYGVYHIDYCRENSNKFKLLALLFTNECGEYVSMMHFGKHDNFYILKNPVKNLKHDEKSLKSITNIVFDLDDHKRTRTPEEYAALCKRTLVILQRDLFYDDIIPLPSWVVYTGRGIQLHWNLYSNVAYESYIKKYERIVEYWGRKFRECLKSCGEDVLDYDGTASPNKVGFVRLPGSFNTKAGVYTYAKKMSGARYDLHELYDTVCAHLPTPVFTTKTKNYSLAELGRARCDMVEQLRVIRMHESDIGMRNNMCLVYFISACQFLPRDEARALTERFNSELQNPLKPSALHSTLSTAYRHANDAEKCYKLTNEKIMDLLAISPDEQRKLDFYTKKRTFRGKNAARDERRAKKREALCRAVRKLCRKGYTAYRIAKELDIDYRTAQKRVAEFRAAEESKRAEKEAKAAKIAAEKEAKKKAKEEKEAAKRRELEEAFEQYKMMLDYDEKYAFGKFRFKERRNKLLRHPDFRKRVRETEREKRAEWRKRKLQEEYRKRRTPADAFFADDEAEAESIIKANSDSSKGKRAIIIFGSA